MESNYHKHFERELNLLCKNWDGKTEDEEPIVNKFKDEILLILDKIESQGHSGASIHYYASIVSNAVKNSILMNNIGPITGDESEWGEPIDNHGTVQNCRKSDIFKDSIGAYYLNAIVWNGEKSYDNFTGIVDGICSRQRIKEFPFQPKTFYIDVIKVGDPKENNYTIKDISQLDKVFEYYDKFNQITNN